MIEPPPLEKTPLLGKPSQALVLRLRNTAREGQLIRLEAAKCTVGSAADCTLRLQAEGVQPVHCLILRGPHRTIVRRWSKHTRLNDQPFGDAPLNIGDHLAIGPLDFEVLEGAAGKGRGTRDEGRGDEDQGLRG